MAVIARDQITLSWQLDIKQTIYYYKKQSSTSSVPAKPTAYPPTGWSTTEPAYSTGETSTLYVTVCTIFSDNTYEYSDVTVSSSFEAAKAAYNKAVAAEGVANNAMTAANGKNKIFYQDAAPVSGMSEGDLWFDTDGGNAIHEYKKTASNPDTYAWVLRQFGTGSLVAGSVTANEINVNNLAAISAYLGNAVIGGQNNINGVLTVKDASGNTIGTWDKNGINTIAGTIGGWSIGNTALTSNVTISNVDYATVMQAMGTSTDLARVAFAVRTKSSSDTSWTYPFMVRHNGKLKATDADITGKITASSGTIGGWTIESNVLYKITADENYRIRLQAPDSPTTGNYAIRLDKKENDDWSNLFYLSYGGALYAGNANVKGTITATAGKIGPLFVTTDAIYTDTATGYGTGNGIRIGTNTSYPTLAAISTSDNSRTYVHPSGLSCEKINSTYGASGASITKTHIGVAADSLTTYHEQSRVDIYSSGYIQTHGAQNGIRIGHYVIKGFTPDSNVVRSVNFNGSGDDVGDAYTLGRVDSMLFTSGTSGMYLRAFKNETSSTDNAYIAVLYPASGDPYVTTPNSLRINGHSSAIGTSKSNTGTDVSLAAGGTGKTIATVSLEAGVWIVIGKNTFSNVSSATYVRTYVGSGANSGNADDQRTSSSNSQTVATVVKLVTPSSTTSIYLSASSAVARTCTGTITAIRIQ